MVKKEDNIAKEIRLIGCCGAYCKTCPPLIENYCKGCKLGYDTGKRDINDAKCKMKVCCFKEKKLETCADCPDYFTCKIMFDFHSKNGYKYKKYKQSIEFIRKNGYAEFLKTSKDWKRAYGRLEEH
jgi:hypothetical protein